MKIIEPGPFSPRTLARLTIPIRYLRLHPFDLETAEGRAQERYRQAAWAILANVGSTGLGLVVLVISVGLTVPYLGEERFGVWMTVASLAGMLSFLDLGVGNGLINHVAHARATKNPITLGQSVHRGLLLLVAMGLVLGLLMALLYYLLPLNSLIKVRTPQAAEDTSRTVAIFGILFCASIPLNGIHRIFLGLQRAWQSHLVKAVGHIISIVFVYVLSKEEAGPPELLLATYGVQVFMPTVLLVVLWHEKLLGGRPGFAGPGIWAEWKTLIGTGGLFLALQVGTMIGWGADPLIVSSLLGASEVAKLAIALRLFQFVTIPLSIVNAPLWGAYADAKARGDTLFVRKTFKRSLVATAVIAFATSGTVLGLSPWILKIWVGENFIIPLGLLWAYALWVIIDATGNALAMFLNGVHELWSQIIMVVVFCVLGLTMKLILTPRYGVTAMVIATIVAYLVSISSYLCLFAKRIRYHIGEFGSC